MSKIKNYYLDKYSEDDIQTVLEEELGEQEVNHYER